MDDMTVRSAGAAYPPQPGLRRTGAEREPPPPEEKAEPTPDLKSMREQAEEQSKSLCEMMREAKEKAEEQRKRFKIVKKTNYGDAPMTAYARLARARTHADVNAASGYARRCIAQYKAAMRQDSDNAERIRAAIAQLQKVVTRAGKKKRDLDHEGLVERRRARAMQEERRREAQRLRTELKRRRTMRSIRESGYLREAEIDNRLQDQLAATREELRLQSESLPSLSPEAAAQQYLSMAASAPAVPAPAGGVDIQV